mmetsp:Transcript_88682/g.185369  ORF Transcript_88682/g.185369 Transcript_88682/m.185369 type:complete len:243 (-) Transcript_88682:2552-3280(-)
MDDEATSICRTKSGLLRSPLGSRSMLLQHASEIEESQQRCFLPGASTWLQRLWEMKIRVEMRLKSRQVVLLVEDQEHRRVRANNTPTHQGIKVSVLSGENEQGRPERRLFDASCNRGNVPAERQNGWNDCIIPALAKASMRMGAALLSQSFTIHTTAELDCHLPLSIVPDSTLVNLLLKFRTNSCCEHFPPPNCWVLKQLLPVLFADARQLEKALLLILGRRLLPHVFTNMGLKGEQTICIA